MVKSRSWRLLWDAAVFHYLAWLITEGVVPYRDIFDIQFPGTYIVHILIIKLLGGSDGAWRIFDLSCLVIIDGLILLFCRPFGRLTAWLGVALFSSFHLFFLTVPYSCATVNKILTREAEKKSRKKKS